MASRRSALCAAAMGLLAALAVAPRAAANLEITAECSPACPSNPRELCDFWFYNSIATVPTFQLPAKNGDAPLSALPLRFNSTDPRFVSVGGSGNAVVLGTNSPNAVPRCNAGQQFYATGQRALVLVRTIQPGTNPATFKGKCFKLPLASFQVYEGGQPLNVQPTVPNARKCVVFKIA